MYIAPRICHTNTQDPETLKRFFAEPFGLAPLGLDCLHTAHRICSANSYLRGSCPCQNKKDLIIYDIILKELSDEVIGIAFDVHNHLGPGLLESAYAGAFCVGLSKAGIPFECQKPYQLFYLGKLIGTYVADIVVHNSQRIGPGNAKAFLAYC
ncbi:MAG: GxxExxY protein [Spirochaetales bacterium]|nr:GxxExxY protein [Spirochaetales bacterium]